MISTESTFQRLSEFIQSQLPRLNAPGIAIGITSRERILHTGYFGLANLDAGEAVAPDTLFQIGSIGKSFTSIILLQLQEKGILDINDPVTKYLPWFEIQSEIEAITLRHLMSHTAGIICGSDETVSAFTETWNLRHTKATASPGELFHYSNGGYKMLGLILETLLEQSISDILREHIFATIGMSATLPDIRTTDRHRLAVGYAPYHDDRPLPPGGLLAPATWLESNTADGSICSTAMDMGLYLQMLLQRGNPLLAPESFEQLIEPIIATDDGLHGQQYGMGLFSQRADGYNVIGHSGGMVGFTADMLADLDSGLGVIALTNGPANLDKISRYTLSLFRAAMDGDEHPVFSGNKIDDAGHYAGTYCCGKKVFTLTSDGNRIFLNFEADTVPLTPLSTDNFIVPHPEFEQFPLHMERENDLVTEAGWGEERYIRDGVEVETPIKSPTEWDAYPGHFRSHNPWMSNFRVVLRKGLLVLIDPVSGESPLYQLSPGLFRVGDDPRSPEFIRFDVIIHGKAMRVDLSGGIYSRAFTP